MQQTVPPLKRCYFNSINVSKCFNQVINQQQSLLWGILKVSLATQYAAYPFKQWESMEIQRTAMPAEWQHSCKAILMLAGLKLVIVFMISPHTAALQPLLNPEVQVPDWTTQHQYPRLWGDGWGAAGAWTFCQHSFEAEPLQYCIKSLPWTNLGTQLNATRALPRVFDLQRLDPIARTAAYPRSFSSEGLFSADPSSERLCSK